MESINNNPVITDHRVKVFRWYYYIALLQFLMYFIVPILIFPGQVIKDIEVISALTLGLFVGLFFLIVNVIGLFLDRSRRVLYILLSLVIIIYFTWAIISWAYIEHMDYLLR